MITESYSTVEKNVTQEQAWKLMTNVANWKNWDPTVADAELHGEFKTGTFFTLHTKDGPKAEIELVEVRPMSYYRDLAKLPFAQMTGEHSFETTPEGLKLTVTMSIRGPLGFFFNWIVMKDIISRLPEDLKTLAEEARKI